MLSNFQQILILKANILPELSSKQNQPKHSNNNNNKKQIQKPKIKQTKKQAQILFQGTNHVNEKI